MEMMVSTSVEKAIPMPDSKKVCKIVKDLTGQVIIITGSSSGIGKETVRVLAYMNPTIIMACKNEEKTMNVIEEIKKESGNENIVFMELDLGDLSTIKKFAEEFKSKYDKLDILINNAGVSQSERLFTQDGFEQVFGTNMIGHFYLTKLLLDVLQKSAPSRIINVSSKWGNWGKMHWDDLMLEKDYTSVNAYSQSKLALFLFTKELQKRYGSSGIKAVSLHPGNIDTKTAHEYRDKWYIRVVFWFLHLFQTDQLEGAQTSLYCALEDHEKLVGGAYYNELKLDKEQKSAHDEENWKRLWDVCEKLISEKGF